MPNILKASHISVFSRHCFAPCYARARNNESAMTMVKTQKIQPEGAGSTNTIFLQKGFSLLELLFVLAVVALVVVAAVGRYQQSKWNENLVVTQRSVQTLLQALNHYFYENCGKRDYDARMNAVNTNALGINSVLIQNPFGDAFTVQISELEDGDRRPIYQLKLSAKYPSASMANALRQQLGADAGTSETLTWSRQPSLSIADSNSAYWIQSEAFNQKATDNLRAYAVQNPTVFIGVCNNQRPKP